MMHFGSGVCCAGVLAELSSQNISDLDLENTLVVIGIAGESGMSSSRSTETLSQKCLNRYL